MEALSTFGIDYRHSTVPTVSAFWPFPNTPLFLVLLSRTFCYLVRYCFQFSASLPACCFLRFFASLLHTDCKDIKIYLTSCWRSGARARQFCALRAKTVSREGGPGLARFVL